MGVLLVDRDQEGYSTSNNEQDSLHNSYPAQNVSSAKVEKPQVR